MRYSTTADLIEKWLPLSVIRAKDRVEFQITHVMSWTYFQISSRRVPLAKWGISILVLLLAFPLGILTNLSQEINELLPYLLIGLFFSPVALMIVQKFITRYEWSPVMILFAAIFVPIELPTGTASVIVDSLLIALIFTGNWIMQMIIVDKRLTLEPSPLNKPFWGFAVITMISLIWSMFFADPLVYFKGSFPVVQIGSAVVNIMLPITLYLVINHINHIKQLKVMVVLILIGGLGSLIVRMGGVRSLATVINDGGLLTMWVAVVGVGMGIFNDKLSWYWRFAAIAIGFSLQAYRLTQDMAWLAGWLPGVLGLAVLLFRRSKILVVWSIVACVAVILINIGTVTEAYEAESQESGDTRLHAWQTNWRITGKHLLFGTGQAAYINYYVSYFSDEGFQIQATHNTVLDLLAQNGFFGLFFVLWYFIALILWNYRICLRFKGRHDFSEALANACFAGTISSSITMVFGDWLFPFAYTQTISGYDYIVYTWLFMGTGIALEKLAFQADSTQQGKSKLQQVAL